MSNYVCLQPAKLGKLELKNRIVLPPMVCSFATRKSGAMTEQYIEFLAERAKGGVGLIVLEASSVHASGKGFPRGICIDSDVLIPQLRRMTNRLHEYGTKVSIQLHHAGRQTSCVTTGQPIVAPSDCEVDYSTERPHALTKKEIKIIVEAFGQAARRAREAGFDAVQLHGAHGYILTQFMSPYTNKRTDEYGGSLENRMRFPLEVIKRVREAVGDDFTITYRLSVEEGVEKGLMLDEGSKIAKILADSGIIDGIHVVAGNYDRPDLMIPVQACPACSNETRAATISKVINKKIPIITVAKIKTLENADRLIRENKADFIALGRPLICEPFLIQKTLENKTATIKPCVSCKEGCEYTAFKGFDLGCILNPRVGEEGIYKLGEKSKTPKNVIIIGAGVAGLEAACTAAERGHTVHLYEKSGRIGGLLHEASIPPHKEDLKKIIPYYQARLEEAGVNLHLNTEMTAQKAKTEKADAIIVAVGANLFLPNITGADTIDSYFAVDVLNETVNVGKHAVVVGGGQVGCETAEFLLKQNIKVTIVEMLSELAVTMEPVAKGLMLKRFAMSNIETLLNTAICSIDKNRVIINQNGQEASLDNIDTVVWATGFRNSPLVKNEFLQLDTPVFFAGDCLLPADINQATQAGFKIAYSL